MTKRPGLLEMCCNGKMAPLCLLDMVTRCKIKRICDLHDRALMRLAYGDDREAA